MSNMCRDEITSTLKQKLDGVFGSSFNTNGLGGVLTCGVTGVKAGLSHSPISEVRPQRKHALTRGSMSCRSGSQFWLKHRRCPKVGLECFVAIVEELVQFAL